MNKYYITTTLPYVNAKPHIGFALEIIQADVLARYHTLLDDEVVFNTGTDEHGLKIFRKAEELGVSPQAYCDEWAGKFDALKQALNLSYTSFIRTTDKHHEAAAQKFWKLCLQNEDIYKKNYQVKYCVGCELEKTDSELVDDKCPVHPNLDLEIIDEENYFFKFSKYQEPLLEMYKANPDFVVPQHRFNEITKFVERGLQDFSISRIKEKMPWGVLVPGDAEQVIYVWFDALVNYISTLGWPDDKENFEKFWPGVQVAGKDNLRQQTAMWQAMLLSAGLPTSKQVFIHGFITSEGQKMSKSLGNVVDPFKIAEKYGTDALRYYILGAVPSYDDGDFSIERFEEFYTAHLVNGVGNLTSRVLTMLEKYNDNKIPQLADDKYQVTEFWKKYNDSLSKYNFEECVKNINSFVGEIDALISNEKPWAKAKNGEDISELLYQLAEGLRHIAVALLPIIPESAKNILDQLGTKDLSHNWGKLLENGIIKKGEILFPRLK
ncbi:MAG: methionine--tRNA ligase [Candidatus Magasanikbacteria bacterium]|nr:methionine--tRNA ligase [Candidatus Magasanikbacteria bacterium]MBT4315304.1 methionine--tRNA ligase [Candidatus Magasanikbacteria bacterium]MBT4547176.1 methionine--tRNA ligase [Candidatus Magasanikbacteria bacterium]MBT6819684.1 methionine--tRNA ligase [Candidatus Magasanikbacteria bacterium]